MKTGSEVAVKQAEVKTFSSIFALTIKMTDQDFETTQERLELFIGFKKQSKRKMLSQLFSKCLF